jgi:cation:H+ antiporter
VLHVVTLLACAVTIYFACEWFINAIEWLGVELKVGPLAVGTVLAAVGTALPESIVTLVAALFGSPARGDDIAVGAAMGGPLVVGTIAYGVTGAMLFVAVPPPASGRSPRGRGTERHGHRASHPGGPAGP